uniref:Uncharacterized protein n=1 Tax=Romanomermis culicivorax TaxID=13658 RepID=A0A915KZL8_ROMCU
MLIETPGNVPFKTMILRPVFLPSADLIFDITFWIPWSMAL